jgi:hypothetical protein
MFEPTRLPDGRLRIPLRAESEDGMLVGDGVVTLDQTHPDYAKWDAVIRERERGGVAR